MKYYRGNLYATPLMGKLALPEGRVPSRGLPGQSSFVLWTSSPADDSTWSFQPASFTHSSRSICP